MLLFAFSQERNASLAQQAAAAAADITGGGPEVITDSVGPPTPGESLEDRRRKLSCLAAVLQREAREHPESQVKTARVMVRTQPHHTHTRARPRAHTHTHAHTQSHSHTHSHTVTHTVTRTQSHTHAHTQSHTHSHTPTSLANRNP